MQVACTTDRVYTSGRLKVRASDLLVRYAPDEGYADEERCVADCLVTPASEIDLSTVVSTSAARSCRSFPIRAHAHAQSMAKGSPPVRRDDDVFSAACNLAIQRRSENRMSPTLELQEVQATGDTESPVTPSLHELQRESAVSLQGAARNKANRRKMSSGRLEEMRKQASECRELLQAESNQDGDQDGASSSLRYLVPTTIVAIVALSLLKA